MGRARSKGGLITEFPASDVAPPPPPPPEVTPVFDPERLAVQTYSAEGGQGFIQGKNFFNASGRFIRELPEAQWYLTTPEQEENNRKARARQRVIFGPKAAKSLLPAKVVQMAHENNKALAAEALAE